MRRVAIACALAGCGRLGFDARALTGDGALGDSARDGALGDGSGGSAAITFVQASPIDIQTGPVTPTLPAPSMPGSLLVAEIATNVAASLVVPTGWSTASEITGGGCTALLAYRVDVAGGTTAVTFGQAAGVPTVAALTEWQGVRAVTPVDVIGTASSPVPASTQTVSTTQSPTRTGDVAIATFCQDANNGIYIPGTGWNTLGAWADGPANPSFIAEYRLDVPMAATTATVSVNVAGKYAAAIATFQR